MDTNCCNVDFYDAGFVPAKFICNLEEFSKLFLDKGTHKAIKSFRISELHRGTTSVPQHISSVAHHFITSCGHSQLLVFTKRLAVPNSMMSKTAIVHPLPTVQDL